MNYFFDLINEISGYTDKYYNETIDKIDHEGLIQKYRAEKIKYEKDINESPMLGDKYPHSLMVLESVQDLMKMTGPIVKGENLAQNYFDQLILRVLPGTDMWYRNHFPIIFESNSSHYFGEKIYNQLNVPEWTFPTIEFGSAVTGGGAPAQPYEKIDKLKNLSHIFNKDQIEILTERLGKSIYFTHVFTELIKARK
jgi:hypothetical protein